MSNKEKWIRVWKEIEIITDEQKVNILPLDVPGSISIVIHDSDENDQYVETGNLILDHDQAEFFANSIINFVKERKQIENE